MTFEYAGPGPESHQPSSTPCDLTHSPHKRVVDFIEATLGKIVVDIQERPCGRPSITLRRITDIKLQIDVSSGQMKRVIVDRTVTYSFPGRNKDEAWRFACVGKILADIYVAVRNGVTITKRDVFYRDPLLYKKQAIVDRYIDDIGHTCQVTRKDLHVTASPRGLVAGLWRSCHVEPEVTFETVSDLGLEVSASCIQHVKWILIVEKEATFKALTEKNFHRSNGGGLLITGKGYPDLATRRILRICLDHSCWDTRKRPILLGLFDCDPYGIDIMRTYRHGSINLAHEQQYNVPEMKWLGVKLFDVVDNVRDDEPVMPLTQCDRMKARVVLDAQCRYPDDPLHEWCKMELVRMLTLNRKAEIQVLEERPGGLEAWVHERVVQELAASA